MKTYQRQDFNTDAQAQRLYLAILILHKTPDHTQRNLLEQAHIENFCEITKVFVMFPERGRKTIYASYQVCTWIKHNAIEVIFPVKVEEITIYDNYVEYETTRIRELSATDPKDRDSSTMGLN